MCSYHIFSGCFYSMSKRITTEEWKKECIAIHGDEFDYTESVYINSKTLIEIRCKTHGIIKVNPNRHKKGSKCRRCYAEANSPFKKGTLEELKVDFKIVHGDRYNYDKLKDFKTQHDKGIITCKIHGDFEQKLYSHKAGSGCEKCSYIERGINSRISLEDFKSRSNVIHSDKFCYDKTIFETLADTVIITCPHHGDFKQKGKDHFYSGCNQCGKIASSYTYEKNSDYIEISKSLKSGVYLMKINDMFKIGITKHIQKRINLIRSRLSEGTNIELLSYLKMSLFNAVKLEDELHERYKDYSTVYPEYFEGQTECFNLNLPIEEIKSYLLTYN